MWAAQRMPPFTREAQEWIWHRQNPPRRECSTSKYLFIDNIEQQVCVRYTMLTRSTATTDCHPKE